MPTRHSPYATAWRTYSHSNRQLCDSRAGDVITGIGYQFSDGQKIVRLERVVLAEGKELRLYGR